jgi:ubiquinone/menaquinone biosynthesis C-methylase UbiE
MLAASDLEVEFIDLPGESIPLEANSVDTVLVTYSLCTIPDAVAALAGMRRVLKPGGSLLFCEHGIAPDESVRRWQRRLSPAWRKVAGGCHLDRDIPELITKAGFVLVADERMYIPGIKALCYNYWGRSKAYQ